MEDQEEEQEEDSETAEATEMKDVFKDEKKLGETRGRERERNPNIKLKQNKKIRN